MHIAILGVVSANGVDSRLEDEGEDEFGVRVKTKRHDTRC